MNTEALNQLKRVALAIPDDKLHSWLWGDPNGTEGCCIGGWARRDPWFLANTRIHQAIEREIGNSPDATDTLAGVFGIDRDDAGALFGWHFDDTVAVVAAIDTLLRGEHLEDDLDDLDDDEEDFDDDIFDDDDDFFDDLDEDDEDDDDFFDDDDDLDED